MKESSDDSDFRMSSYFRVRSADDATGVWLSGDLEKAKCKGKKKEKNKELEFDVGFEENMIAGFTLRDELLSGKFLFPCLIV